MSDLMIDADQLSISFGSVTALDHASIGAARGSVLGLLGHNGAGESAYNCYHDPEYEAAHQLRIGAAEGDLVIVEGYDGPSRDLAAGYDSRGSALPGEEQLGEMFLRPGFQRLEDRPE